MAVDNCLDPDINFLNLPNMCHRNYIEVSKLNDFFDLKKKNWIEYYAPKLQKFEQEL